MRLRVLLAEDHQVMREGLRSIINAQADMEVVGEAGDGLAVVRLSKELKPNVVIMDLSMPESTGLQATETLRRVCPDVSVVVLTRHGDRGSVQQLLSAGARGYVLKRSASDELVRAIHRVAAGQTYLDPMVTDKIFASSVGRRRSADTAPAKTLSNREEEILRLVASGFLCREVADQLAISVKTVETHKMNAMNKLDLKNRVDVVRYAVLRGWLQDG